MLIVLGVIWLATRASNSVISCTSQKFQSKMQIIAYSFAVTDAMPMSVAALESSKTRYCVLVLCLFL